MPTRSIPLQQFLSFVTIIKLFSIPYQFNKFNSQAFTECLMQVCTWSDLSVLPLCILPLPSSRLSCCSLMEETHAGFRALLCRSLIQNLTLSLSRWLVPSSHLGSSSPCFYLLSSHYFPDCTYYHLTHRAFPAFVYCLKDVMSAIGGDTVFHCCIPSPENSAGHMTRTQSFLNEFCCLVRHI